MSSSIMLGSTDGTMNSSESSLWRFIMDANLAFASEKEKRCWRAVDDSVMGCHLCTEAGGTVLIRCSDTSCSKETHLDCAFNEGGLSIDEAGSTAYQCELHFTPALFCTCKAPYDEAKEMVYCDECCDWFHNKCEGLKVKDALTIDSYICRTCTRTLKEGKQVSKKLKADNLAKESNSMYYQRAIKVFTLMLQLTGSICPVLDSINADSTMPFSMADVLDALRYINLPVFDQQQETSAAVEGGEDKIEIPDDDVVDYGRSVVVKKWKLGVLIGQWRRRVGGYVSTMGSWFVQAKRAHLRVLRLQHQPQDGGSLAMLLSRSTLTELERCLSDMQELDAGVIQSKVCLPADVYGFRCFQQAVKWMVDFLQTLHAEEKSERWEAQLDLLLGSIGPIQRRLASVSKKDIFCHIPRNIDREPAGGGVDDEKDEEEDEEQNGVDDAEDVEDATNVLRGVQFVAVFVAEAQKAIGAIQAWQLNAVSILNDIDPDGEGNGSDGDGGADAKSNSGAAPSDVLFSFTDLQTFLQSASLFPTTPGPLFVELSAVVTKAAEVEQRVAAALMDTSATESTIESLNDEKNALSVVLPSDDKLTAVNERLIFLKALDSVFLGGGRIKEASVRGLEVEAERILQQSAFSAAGDDGEQDCNFSPLSQALDGRIAAALNQRLRPMLSASSEVIRAAAHIFESSASSAAGLPSAQERVTTLNALQALPLICAEEEYLDFLQVASELQAECEVVLRPPPTPATDDTGIMKPILLSQLESLMYRIDEQLSNFAIDKFPACKRQKFTMRGARDELAAAVTRSRNLLEGVGQLVERCRSGVVYREAVTAGAAITIDAAAVVPAGSGAATGATGTDITRSVPIASLAMLRFLDRDAIRRESLMSDLAAAKDCRYEDDTASATFTAVEVYTEAESLLEKAAAIVTPSSDTASNTKNNNNNNHSLLSRLISELFNVSINPARGEWVAEKKRLLCLVNDVAMELSKLPVATNTCAEILRMCRVCCTAVGCWDAVFTLASSSNSNGSTDGSNSTDGGSISNSNQSIEDLHLVVDERMISGLRQLHTSLVAEQTATATTQQLLLLLRPVTSEFLYCHWVAENVLVRTQTRLALRLATRLAIINNSNSSSSSNAASISTTGNNTVSGGASSSSSSSSSSLPSTLSLGQALIDDYADIQRQVATTAAAAADLDNKASVFLERFWEQRAAVEYAALTEIVTAGQIQCGISEAALQRWTAAKSRQFTEDDTMFQPKLDVYWRHWLEDTSGRTAAAGDVAGGEEGSSNNSSTAVPGLRALLQDCFTGQRALVLSRSELTDRLQSAMDMFDLLESAHAIEEKLLTAISCVHNDAAYLSRTSEEVRTGDSREAAVAAEAEAVAADPFAVLHAAAPCAPVLDFGELTSYANKLSLCVDREKGDAVAAATTVPYGSPSPSSSSHFALLNSLYDAIMEMHVKARKWSDEAQLVLPTRHMRKGLVAAVEGAGGAAGLGSDCKPAASDPTASTLANVVRLLRQPIAYAVQLPMVDNLRKALEEVSMYRSALRAFLMPPPNHSASPLVADGSSSSTMLHNWDAFIAAKAKKSVPDNNDNDDDNDDKNNNNNSTISTSHDMNRSSNIFGRYSDVYQIGTIFDQQHGVESLQLLNIQRSAQQTILPTELAEHTTTTWLLQLYQWMTTVPCPGDSASAGDALSLEEASARLIAGVGVIPGNIAVFDPETSSYKVRRNLLQAAPTATANASSAHSGMSPGGDESKLWVVNEQPLNPRIAASLVEIGVLLPVPGPAAAAAATASPPTVLPASESGDGPMEVSSSFSSADPVADPQEAAAAAAISHQLAFPPNVRTLVVLSAELWHHLAEHTDQCQRAANLSAELLSVVRDTNSMAKMRRALITVNRMEGGVVERATAAGVDNNSISNSSKKKKEEEKTEKKKEKEAKLAPLSASSRVFTNAVGVMFRCLALFRQTVASLSELLTSTQHLLVQLPPVTRNAIQKCIQSCRSKIADAEGFLSANPSVTAPAKVRALGASKISKAAGVETGEGGKKRREEGGDSSSSSSPSGSSSDGSGGGSSSGSDSDSNDDNNGRRRGSIGSGSDMAARMQKKRSLQQSSGGSNSLANLKAGSGTVTDYYPNSGSSTSSKQKRVVYFCAARHCLAKYVSNGGSGRNSSAASWVGGNSHLCPRQATTRFGQARFCSDRCAVNTSEESLISLQAYRTLLRRYSRSNKNSFGAEAAAVASLKSALPEGDRLAFAQATVTTNAQSAIAAAAVAGRTATGGPSPKGTKPGAAATTAPLQALLQYMPSGASGVFLPHSSSSSSNNNKGSSSSTASVESELRLKVRTAAEDMFFRCLDKPLMSSSSSSSGDCNYDGKGAVAYAAVVAWEVEEELYRRYVSYPSSSSSSTAEDGSESQQQQQQQPTLSAKEYSQHHLMLMRNLNQAHNQELLRRLARSEVSAEALLNMSAQQLADTTVQQLREKQKIEAVKDAKREVSLEQQIEKQRRDVAQGNDAWRDRDSNNINSNNSSSSGKKSTEGKKSSNGIEDGDNDGAVTAISDSSPRQSSSSNSPRSPSSTGTVDHHRVFVDDMEENHSQDNDNDNDIALYRNGNGSSSSSSVIKVSKAHELEMKVRNNATGGANAKSNSNGPSSSSSSSESTANNTKKRPLDVDSMTRFHSTPQSLRPVKEARRESPPSSVASISSAASAPSSAGAAIARAAAPNLLGMLKASAAAAAAAAADNSSSGSSGGGGVVGSSAALAGAVRMISSLPSSVGTTGAVKPSLTFSVQRPGGVHFECVGMVHDRRLQGLVPAIITVDGRTRIGDLEKFINEVIVHGKKLVIPFQLFVASASASASDAKNYAKLCTEFTRDKRAGICNATETNTQVYFIPPSLKTAISFLVNHFGAEEHEAEAEAGADEMMLYGIVVSKELSGPRHLVTMDPSDLLSSSSSTAVATAHRISSSISPAQPTVSLASSLTAAIPHTATYPAAFGPVSASAVAVSDSNNSYSSSHHDDQSYNNVPLPPPPPSATAVPPPPAAPPAAATATATVAAAPLPPPLSTAIATAEMMAKVVAFCKAKGVSVTLQTLRAKPESRNLMPFLFDGHSQHQQFMDAINK